MAISAKVSAIELEDQVRARFENQFLEAILINLPGATYISGEPGMDATFLAGEVPLGTGGYRRQIIRYTPADISLYADDGVALNNKAAVFSHNGTAQELQFSHVALVWGEGEVENLGAITVYPTPGSSNTGGPYTNLPVSGGSGSGMTVDLTVTNSGLTSGDFQLTIVNYGYGYQPGDELTITEAVLVNANVTSTVAGPLVFSPGTIYQPAQAGQILSVAKTTNTVVLAGGNQAAFYFNLKQFGFYNF